VKSGIIVQDRLPFPDFATVQSGLQIYAHHGLNNRGSSVKGVVASILMAEIFAAR
jgi:hypothetical protein